MFKKIVLSAFAVLFLFQAVFVRTAFAQAPGGTLPAYGPWYHQTFTDWYKKVYDADNPDEIFGERYTAAQVEWVMYGLIAFIIHAFGNEGLYACVMKNSDGVEEPGVPETLANCKDLLIQAVGIAQNDSNQNSWLASFDRPYSGIGYLKDIGTKLHIIPEAEAQGFGFTAVNPILQLWRIVRDLTYFLLILVIVVMAFMIMFRVRTSPQTVITIQSAIPRIIFALILITFSYAIAGFMIDLMYVVIGLMAAVVQGSGLTELSWPVLFDSFTNKFTVLSMIFVYWVAFVVIALLAVVSNAFGAIFGTAFIGGLFTPAGGILAVIFIILIVIVLLMLLIIAFKIWFMLVKTFVNVLLLTIIGPFQILFGTLGFGGFGSWLKSIISNLAVFPVTSIMFFVAFVFLVGGLPNGDWIPGWDALLDVFVDAFPFNIEPSVFDVPTGTTPWIPPLMWGTEDLDLVWVAASLIVITLIPKVADIIKHMIEGRPYAYGSAIGEGLALPILAGRGVASGAVGWTAQELKEGTGRLGTWIDNHPRIARVARGGIASRILDTVQERARRGL